MMTHALSLHDAVIFVDATIIRMVLVPAIMHLAGEWNWWPGYRKPRGGDRVKNS